MEIPNNLNREEISSIILGYSNYIFETLMKLRETGNESKYVIKPSSL